MPTFFLEPAGRNQQAMVGGLVALMVVGLVAFQHGFFLAKTLLISSRL